MVSPPNGSLGHQETRRPVVLVVAAPEDDGRVVAKRLDGHLRLAADVPEEPLLLRVHGAGEHEILPDHDASAVAGFVEGGRLVDAAAPDAKHVHVGVDGHLHPFVVVLARQARQVAVGGDPVGALAEDLAAVDDEDERLALVVLLALELDGADADADPRAGRATLPSATSVTSTS